MSFLPISINITHKNILIVGGGNAAHQKIINLLSFTTNITVVSPQISENIKQLSNITCINDVYKKDYLKGIFLVYACTDSTEVNAQIFKDAEALNILCNRTDKSEVSHFHSPGIATTDEMTIAITSKKKEVKKMVKLRNEIRHILSEKEQLLKEKEALKGKVFLVGFGPGNPDLLTRKGEQLLFQADVIFYDDLLDADALNKYSGEKIYVGKRRDNHSKEQAEINDVLYQAAIKGNMVVRLKGGDPLIFGRGSEERYYLEKRGISVEIIPGISSAVAAASYGNIPLTHRGISSSVAFGTAHGKNSYKILESDTSVYYMGAKNIREIAQKYLDKGYPSDFPVGLVYKASFPDQEVTKTNITELAQGKLTIKSPVISIFGNTVNYQDFMEKE